MTANGGAFLQPADRIARPGRLSLRREAPVVRCRRLPRMMGVASRSFVDHPVAILCAGATARQVRDRPAAVRYIDAGGVIILFFVFDFREGIAFQIVN